MPLYSDFGLYYSPHLSTTPSYYSSPFLGTSGRSSGLGLFPAPRVIPRVAPLLPSIPEASSYSSSSRPRASSALDRYIPPPPSASRYKPLRIDTADIDVSSNRYGSSTSSSHGPSTPERDNTIKRGRTVVRLHTKKCKESPSVETPRRKMTPGEKLMQKFLILDKAEEEAKAARRKRLEELEIRERAEAEVARLQALAAAKADTANATETEVATPQHFPTIGGITENAALDILLSTTEDEEHVSGGEISRSSSGGTIKRRKSKGTVKDKKRKTKKRESSLVEGDETDSPGGNGDEPTCSLQRRNTVRFRRNSQDVDAFPEVDLTAGSRRSSIDQLLPGSRRSSLDSSTGDEIPLANQKRGTVKRRKDPPHRIVVADVSVDNGSSSSSLNSPKFVVDDVKVEQSTAPKVFRYEVIVEDVEGERLTSKHKVSKGDTESKKKKPSDSDPASSESDGLSASNIEGSVSQKKGEKKDSNEKSFQKSQSTLEIETAARLNACKTDECKINFKSKEDAENLPLENVGRKENGTNKNEKGLKQINVKNNKLNQKNVEETKAISQPINTQKNALPGGKQKIQNSENQDVLDKKPTKRQEDLKPVEDSPNKDSKESNFNFWDQLNPDEENKKPNESSQKMESSLPVVNESDGNKSKNRSDEVKVAQVLEKKPIPKWKEKLQADKNIISKKTEEIKQKSDSNEDKKQETNQKGFMSNNKSNALAKDENKISQEYKVHTDPVLDIKENNNEQKPETLSASSLDKENISSKGQDKMLNIEKSGKLEEKNKSKNDSLLPQVDQKIMDKVKGKSSLTENKPIKPPPKQESAEAPTKKLNESTEKSKDSKDTLKVASSPGTIQVPKEVTQGSSPNTPLEKTPEAPLSPTRKFVSDSKNEIILNEPATGMEVVQRSKDALTKDEATSQKPPMAKRFVQEKSKEDLPNDESANKLVNQRSKKDEPVASNTTKNVAGQKTKEDVPKKESATSDSAKILIEPKSKENETATTTTAKNIIGQKSKEGSPKDERSVPLSVKKLVGQKSKEDSPKATIDAFNSANKLIEPKCKEDKSAAPTISKKLVGLNNKEDSRNEESIASDLSKKEVGQESKEVEAVAPITAKKELGQTSKEDSLREESGSPATPNKLIGQKSKESESATSAATKKVIGQKSKEGSPKDESSVPTTKKLVALNSTEDSPKDESDSLNSTKKLGELKSKEDTSAEPSPAKKLVGPKKKDNEPAAPKVAKKLVGQKSKEDSSEGESTMPNTAKKIVERKNQEDESGKPTKPKKLVGQKSKENESATPTKKKVGAPKGKEDTPNVEPPTLNTAKKLVGQKSKEDESGAPSTAKKLVAQKSKDESATPAAPKKQVGQKNKKGESDTPAVPKKPVGKKSKDDESVTTTSKGKQQSPSVGPDTQKPAAIGGKKIIGKANAKVEQITPSDKTVTANQGIPKKKALVKESDAAGKKMGAKVLPPPTTSESGSDADSEESSSEDEDTTPRNSSSSTTTGSTGSSSGSASSDSGFDSRPSSVPGSPPSNKKVSSTASEASGSREPGSPAPSAYSATLDPYSEDAGLLQSGSGASGRTTPPATSLPRFRKYTVDDFQFLKLLGKGTFGKVLLAELRGTDRYYAVKCLKKDVVLEDDDVECTLIERKVLALGTKHPYLCHLFCTFQTESHLLFVMEYLNGGDLMFHIQQSGRFPEPRARFYAAEIVCGLRFLHKKGIVYRDLKLDNILLDYEGHVRIADFGMCKLQIFLDRTADTFCGTPDYMAPEIIKGLKYNQCVDWWSFGVLTFEMLVGVSPFSGCDEDELFWSICNEQPQYPRFLSREAHSLLASLLEKDAQKRLGTPDSPKGDVPDHVFFRSIDWGALERRELEPPFRPRVKYPLDVQYFDTAFTAERPELTPVDASILQSMDQAQFHGFSYTNPNATD